MAALQVNITDRAKRQGRMVEVSDGCFVEDTRFDDFSLSELLEIRSAADGSESWFGAMVYALERKRGLS